jgi:uncharacterized protein YgiM (DUF1202 family)
MYLGSNKLLVVKTENNKVANIRNKPSLDAEIVGTANEGDTFKYTSYSDSWYQIELDDGSLAYISEILVQVKGE